MKLVVKLTQRSNSSVDPVTLGMLRRNVQHQYKVGRVSGGAEYAASGTGLIHRTLVDLARFELVRLARSKPDDRHTVEEDLGQRLGE